MARSFILVAMLTAGGLAACGPFVTDNPETLINQLDDDVYDVDGDIAVIEVPEGTTHAADSEEIGDGISLLALVANSTATSIDVAGVQRDAVGHPIDAPPGSRDAADTGMQHDAAGTVRNTVSPEPTPSPTVEAALEQNSDLQSEPVPTQQV